MSPKIAVAIVPRDRFSMFPRCLKALYAHTNVPFRVIVVAGGADIATREYLDRVQAQMGNVSVVLADHLMTQAEERNVAMRQADERFVVVLENDTILHDNWLPPLLDCMREEEAAVVTPLILDAWHRGVHAAGGTFTRRIKDGRSELQHRMLYEGLEVRSLLVRRRRIDYAETHCILMDRQRLSGIDIFEEVEPFDVDLGLTLRNSGLSVFLEPRSVATYADPPPWELRDLPVFRFRWNAETWKGRNQQFMKKWGVAYDSSSKQVAYQRQLIKLRLTDLYPTRSTVGMTNLGVSSVKLLKGIAARGCRTARRRLSGHVDSGHVATNG